MVGWVLFSQLLASFYGMVSRLSLSHSIRAVEMELSPFSDRTMHPAAGCHYFHPSLQFPAVQLHRFFASAIYSIAV